MLGDRLGLTGWLAAAAVVVVTFLVGFVWLPALQENARGGWWDAICRAVGISPPAEFVRATPGPAQSPTDVVWNPETLRLARSGDAQRGSALAAVCAGCHGAKGISPTDAFPNLAGLPAEVLYKQLDDYRGGKRKSPHDAAAHRQSHRPEHRRSGGPFRGLSRSRRSVQATLPRLRWSRSAARSARLRPAPPATARSDTSSARRRSPGRSALTSRRSSTPSPPAPGRTTSTSRCAKWRGH